MRAKTHVVYDIKSEKFKYLHREENKIRNIVDIDVLNKRLNHSRKSNIYTNAKMIIFSLIAIISFLLISLKF